MAPDLIELPDNTKYHLKRILEMADDITTMGDSVLSELGAVDKKSVGNNVKRKLIIANQKLFEINKAFRNIYD